MRKLLPALAGLIVVAGLTLGGPASVDAGGWVVVSVDEVPEVVSGEPTDIGFTVLRHGATPESSDNLVVVLVAEDGTRTTFHPVPEGPTGHHVVTIEVPSAGRYEWSLQSEAAMPVDLGTISAVAGHGAISVAAGHAAGPSWAWDVVPWVAAGAAVVLAALALVESVRSRRERAKPVAVPA